MEHPRPPTTPKGNDPAPRKIGRAGKTPVEQLRDWMGEAGLEALIVTSEDAHQSEYVSESDLRRAFVTDFDGSAGTAVILRESAFLWTDGRYVLQAAQQCDSSVWEVKLSVPKGQTIGEHLNEILPAESKVGIDPFLVPLNTARTIELKLKEKEHTLVALESNPVDAVWKDRPPTPKGMVSIHPIQHAGLSAGDKIRNLREELTKLEAEAMVVTALDEVAWLLNVRGSDVSYNPVVISYALVTQQNVTWYVDQAKVGPDALSHVQQAGVQASPYSAFPGDLAKLCETAKSVLVDGARSSWAVCRIIAAHESCKLIEKLSPICTAKALKNPSELAGLREAHIRDAVALVKYFSWLEEAMEAEEELDEFSAAEKLDGFRKEDKDYLGLSFETISSYGANGAVIHYAPKKSVCATLKKDSLYLCDSGGQYVDGTTDVTRTFCFATPTDHHKMCYTRVLRGHIGLAAAVFPSGTTGHTLDILARVPLWQAGLDYKHGTGHGVGAYLNVHEGPHLISFYARDPDPPLLENMTSSIEPGYYEADNFGIRIENVAVVVKAHTPHTFGGVDYMTFESLTLVPLSAKLIDMSLLTPDEVRWIDDYHERVWKVVSPRVSGKHAEWLRANTRPLITQVYGEATSP
mmetsp:Transcript_24888/g.61125  ORF Transcript_24888/g.61125 Transcript_24888/m.61125 type:complete len:634 (+) Transcript_24888:25-1926(+)